MKIFRLLFLAFIALLLFCCSGNHLINDSRYLGATEKAFNDRKQLAIHRDSALFSVFHKRLTTAQTEALKFLYAYMPLNDLADYNGDFFLANADMALKTRSESKWGKDIPEDIFLHYVLPYRVNNENLDSFRLAYYDEIRSRITGKDIIDAALEINHWCHEKVSYQASDIRTSAPMSTILSSRGRCGEESTLSVAALRTAGIPARQVYTPRWAHTDDNHAWVEIWFKGSWYYMGACEPEAVPDRGWFTEPARRAMLIHTKSFGASSGNENFIVKNKNFSDVNNLAKYAKTKKISVKVTDAGNHPVENAIVEFQLYNYAEFYPLAKIPTDDHGISSFETGLGDLLIWAHKGDNYNFKKISVGETDTVAFKLDKIPASNENIDLDLDVPIALSPLPGPPEDLTKLNAGRSNKEDLIRQHYKDSWMNPAGARNLALTLKADTTTIMSIISRSMGNYKEISSFLETTPDSLRPVALTLLETLPDKDLRDTKNSILTDHLCAVPAGTSTETDRKLFFDYVLNPRIGNEKLVQWRKYFRKNLNADLVYNAPGNPKLIIDYLNANIAISNDENYYGTPITPVGVNELKVSDSESRAICFVAICRSLGIPSRLEPGRNIPQYFFNKEWNDVYFAGQKQPDQNKGFLKLHSIFSNPVPEYYIQFTIARFEEGRYNTLEYDFNKKITDFKDELALPPGHYMVVTGNRLSSGKILSNISFFDLSENEHKTLEIVIRKDPAGKKILGLIDLEKLSQNCRLKNLSQSCTRYNGMVIIWMETGNEPSRHIFNDIQKMKTEFDKWGGSFIFLTPAEYNHEAQEDLPVNTTFGIDGEMSSLKTLVKFNPHTDIVSPCVIVTDKNGNIVFASTGYRIGIGEEILKYLQ